MNIKEMLMDCPVIAAVKNENELLKALKGECEIIFILFGDIINLKKHVKLVLENKRLPFIHMDMIQGLSSNPVVIDFIRSEFGNRCGIISTRTNLIQQAVENKIPCVYRMFIMDSIAVRNEINLLSKMKYKPDAVEIMPGIMPKVIRKFSEEVGNIPLVAGGLIQEKKEVMDALNAGATAVSTSREDLWD